MSYNVPFSVIAFHSCDREVGVRVLNGTDDLKASNNSWDWLGTGIYFWEFDPQRALHYAMENSQRKQFNKVPIKVSFVLGSYIELGNCLNLIETHSLQILRTAYEDLKDIFLQSGKLIPKNQGNNRALDCAVIQHIHRSHELLGKPPYDTIRCAFPEGTEVYEGSAITSRLHIQICVLNPDCIKGYFLPRPIPLFNPSLLRA